MKQLALACLVIGGLCGCGDGDDGPAAGELEGLVCAEDGKTYSLQEATEKGYAVVHRGSCDAPMRCRVAEDCFIGDACAAVSSEADPVCVPAAGSCVCPTIFDPVCGSDGRTYGSRCEAACAGVEIACPGYCGDPPGEACVRSGCSGQLCVEASMDVASTCEWRPVYECYREATCERQPNGECSFTPTRDLVACLESFEGCVCPEVYSPVCGVDGKTYGNACEAECAGVEIAYQGPCDDCRADGDCAPDEVCIQWPPSEPGQCVWVGCNSEDQCRPGERCVIDDICKLPPAVGDCDAAIERWFFNLQSGERELFVWGGCGGNDNRFETKEACEAACPARAAKLSLAPRAGRCEPRSCDSNQDCGRGLICYPPTDTCQPECDVDCLRYEPVCGTDGNTYGCGEVSAWCHGVEVAYEGECLVACLAADPIGPAIYDPVCGIDGHTYGNACEAEVAGVEIAYKGECVDDGDCREVGCPKGFTCENCVFAAESVRSVCLPPNAGACLPPASN